MLNTKLRILNIILELFSQGCPVASSRTGCCQRSLNVSDSTELLRDDDRPTNLPQFECDCAVMVKERNLSAFAIHTETGRLLLGIFSVIAFTKCQKC